ncbi:MAG: hypothetical protein U9N59_10670 [Campylobacterota bacterium]|nr:hypothetical protein [Campylobacterota bacterium]
MTKKISYTLLILSLFIGCESSNNDNSSSTSIDSKYQVEVFTTAPVINAFVKDSNNQISSYDNNTSKYLFANEIVYPITVTFNSDTFIDIDYDGNKTAIDVLPKFKELKSFCNSTNLLTTLYYTSQYQDINTTTTEYKSDLTNKYNVDVCNNNDSAKILFALSNYIFSKDSSENIDLSISTDIYLDDANMIEEISEVNNFFDVKLSSLSTSNDKIKYYSLYNSLINLDKKIFKRVDTIHIPLIPELLRSSLVVDNQNVSNDVFDIEIVNDIVYNAAGHDTLTSTDKLLSSYTVYSNPSLESFGSSLYSQDYNNSTCLFVTNSMAGISTYSLNSTGATHTQDIVSYNNAGSDENLSVDDGISYVNGYVSFSESKRLLGVSTKDKGFYLINIKDNMNNCTKSTDINSTDFLIEETSGYSVSSAFKGDGTYLYLTNKNNIITGYNIQNLNKDNIEASKKDFTLTTDIEYYNLLLINSGNDLFVTTNKGVELYDVSSSNNLSLISDYTSEGAETDYISKLETNDEFLIFTDAFYGIKILKLSTDLKPELCGVAYFSLLNKPTELAKVTSLKYDSDKLYVGVSEYGIKKIDFNSMLFEHCK